MNSEDLIVWPDASWCYAYESDEYTYMSDDYERVAFGSGVYELLMQYLDN